MPTEQDSIVALMTYIALLGLRDPNLRASVNRFIEGAAAKLSQMMQVLPLEQLRADIAASLEEGEPMPPDEQLEAMRTMKMGRDFTITASNEWFLQSIVTAIDAVAPLLAARKWRLLKSATSEFLTGGRPVALHWTDPSQRDKFFPPAFGVPGTDVLFPLSRHIAMLGRFEGQSTGNAQLVERNQVAGLNTRFMNSAVRFLCWAEGAPDVPCVLPTGVVVHVGSICVTSSQNTKHLPPSSSAASVVRRHPYRLTRHQALSRSHG